MRKTHTLDGDYFENLYRQNGDPWSFTTSAYEREKYRRTLATLGVERAARALEVGCSIGILTEQLAQRCDRLLATDVSPTALEAARNRCAHLPNVEFRQVASPEENLADRFDLIVLSEVVYYWDDLDLQTFAAGLGRALDLGGRLLLVHWLGETDYPRSGDDAVTALWAQLNARYAVEDQSRTAEYRLDLWRRLGR